MQSYKEVVLEMVLGWSDLTLPRTPITVIGYSSPNTSANFEDRLNDMGREDVEVCTWGDHSTRERFCFTIRVNGVAAIPRAVYNSIAFTSIAEAASYGLTTVSLIDQQGHELTPSTDSVRAQVRQASQPTPPPPEPSSANVNQSRPYPFVALLYTVIPRNFTAYHGSGRDLPDEDLLLPHANICTLASEVAHFSRWVLESPEADIRIRANGGLRNSANTSHYVKWLSQIKCLHRGDLITVSDFVHLFKGDAGENSDLDIQTALTVAGNCFAITVLVLGVMLVRRMFNELTEVRKDVWRITELDIVPAYATQTRSSLSSDVQLPRLPTTCGSDGTVSVGTSPAASYSAAADDSKVVFAIYKSVSVALEPTQLQLSTVFDYDTRKSLVELRKLVHRNVQRFYGLADLSEKRDCLNENQNTRFGFSAGDQFSERYSFALAGPEVSMYYAVMEQCSRDSLFFFLHCSSLPLPEELKLPLISSLVSGLEYLHNKRIVHGKLNSQCCYFDHNFTIKIGDWHSLERLERQGCLHAHDLYKPCRFRAYLQQLRLIHEHNTMHRYLDSVDNQSVMLLRWRPPECLLQELPYVQAVLVRQEREQAGKERQDDDLEAKESDLDTDEEEEEEGEERVALYPEGIPLQHALDQSVDAYSLGIMINEIWGRNIPFSDSYPLFNNELDILAAIADGSLLPESDGSMPETISMIFSACTRLLPSLRPTVSTMRKQLAQMEMSGLSGLQIYLDVVDRQVIFSSGMKQAEKKIAALEDEEKRLNAVETAILNECLPKPIAERVGRKEPIPTTYHEEMTVGAINLINFYEVTKSLANDEIAASLNRLNRLMCNIIEEHNVLRISSLGTIVIIAGNPESGDAATQAQAVADCSLDIRQCLRCYGKVPRTSQETEFALAIHTGSSVTGLLPGDAPR
ncbi:hypothetical protein SprV_0501795100 [Sparganum proliferum]